MAGSSSFYQVENPTPEDIETAQQLLNQANAASASAIQSAANAATSETNADASEAAAAASASSASASASAASTSASNAASSASAANTSASNAASSASAASTSATNAATSATSASNSASASSTSATNAATSATNAATSETNAANSATTAQNYANSINPALFVQKSANLGDLANVATARTNLGLATVASSGSASDLTGTLSASQLPAFTGDVTTTAGSSATTIANGSVTSAKMAAGAAVANIGYTPANKAGDTFSGAMTFSATATFSSTDAIKLPVGTTAQRPTGSQGHIRYNTDAGSFEGYNGSSWGSIGGGATGGVSDQIFYLNGQSITQNYSVPSGQNAGTFGPVTINSGVTVTVPSGSTWVIV